MIPYGMRVSSNGKVKWLLTALHCFLYLYFTFIIFHCLSFYAVRIHSIKHNVTVGSVTKVRRLFVLLSLLSVVGV